MAQLSIFASRATTMATRAPKALRRCCARRPARSRLLPAACRAAPALPVMPRRSCGCCCYAAASCAAAVLCATAAGTGAMSCCCRCKRPQPRTARPIGHARPDGRLANKASCCSPGGITVTYPGAWWMGAGGRLPPSGEGVSFLCWKARWSIYMFTACSRLTKPQCSSWVQFLAAAAARPLHGARQRRVPSVGGRRHLAQRKAWHEGRVHLGGHVSSSPSPQPWLLEHRSAAATRAWAAARRRGRGPQSSDDAAPMARDRSPLSRLAWGYRWQRRRASSDRRDIFGRRSSRQCAASARDVARATRTHRIPGGTCHVTCAPRVT